MVIRLTEAGPGLRQLLNTGAHLFLGKGCITQQETTAAARLDVVRRERGRFHTRGLRVRRDFLVYCGILYMGALAEYGDTCRIWGHLQTRGKEIVVDLASEQPLGQVSPGVSATD